MKRQSVALALAGLAVLSSCLQDEEDTYRYDTAPVGSAEAVSIEARTVEFMVKGAFPNTCWDLTEPEVSEVAPHSYTVVLGARYRQGVACATVMAPFELLVPVEVPASGDYEFRFPRKAGDAVAVSVRVP